MKNLCCNFENTPVFSEEKLERIRSILMKQNIENNDIEKIKELLCLDNNQQLLTQRIVMLHYLLESESNLDTIPAQDIE